MTFGVFKRKLKEFDKNLRVVPLNGAKGYRISQNIPKPIQFRYNGSVYNLIKDSWEYVFQCESLGSAIILQLQRRHSGRYKDIHQFGREFGMQTD